MTACEPITLCEAFLHSNVKRSEAIFCRCICVCAQADEELCCATMAASGSKMQGGDAFEGLPSEVGTIVDEKGNHLGVPSICCCMDWAHPC